MYVLIMHDLLNIIRRPDLPSLGIILNQCIPWLDAYRNWIQGAVKLQNRLPIRHVVRWGH